MLGERWNKRRGRVRQRPATILERVCRRTGRFLVRCDARTQWTNRIHTPLLVSHVRYPFDCQPTTTVS